MTTSGGRQPERASVFVLVAGPPGSGKSSLAAPLASELSLPLLAKDAIKDALIEVLGAPATVEDSRELGRAAVMAMLTVARTSPGAVLDSTFYPYTLPHLRALPGQLIEIRCVCAREVVEARYRARSGSRSAGYFDADRPAEELWNKHHLTPLGLGPLIEVDTTDQVDVAAVAAQVRSAVAVCA
jgi:predicted kinase